MCDLGGMDKLVLHVDMDRFYCAVEEKHNPSLRNIPFAVCGNPEMRHRIVMSANSIARNYGVRAGLSFTDARLLCPSLRYVTVDDNKNLTEAKAAREVYYKYSDTVIPYGLDESWLILEDGVTWHEAAQIAELIKLEIMYSLGLSASVGVSYNLIFSKIGSEYQKPNGITVITKYNYREIIWPLPVKELLLVGDVRQRVLTSHGIRTIGDIANADPQYLTKLLRSKVGYDLKQFANGDDRNFHPENDKIGSIGNTITPPKDLKNNDEVSAVLYMLTSAVCARLKKHGLRTRCVAINIRDNKFNTMTRQCTLNTATDNINNVFNHAYLLFTGNYSWQNPLRSVGVRATNLIDSTQTSLFNTDEYVIMIDANSRLKALTERFGKLEVESAGALGRWSICAEDIRC